MGPSLQGVLQSRGYNITRDQTCKGSTQPCEESFLKQGQQRHKTQERQGEFHVAYQMCGFKTMTILDTWASINIVIRYKWKKCCGQALCKTWIDHWLVDRNLEHPLGLLENWVVESCRIEHKHTFVIVDFSQDLNYEVILGWHFMRQMAIQGWGYDYIYLRKEDVITHVNLLDYTYQGVTREPMDEFHSFSPTQIWVLWTLGFFKHGVMTC